MDDNATQLRQWIGHDLIDEEGAKIGRIEDVYVDENTGEPEWVAVTTGLFGTRTSFVPLRDLESDGEHLVSPWYKDVVKDSPNCEADGHLEPEEEQRLYDYYDIAGRTTGGGDQEDRPDPRAARTESDQASVVRSEEELRVGTEKREVGRARLRKWVETEHQTVTVPVRKEKVRLVRESVDGSEVGDIDLTDDSQEITLSEEQVVVDKKVVPKERVRLDKDVEVQEQQVSEELRKERIDVDGDVAVDDTRA